MSIAKALEYEETPIRKVSKETSKRVMNKAYKNAVGEHSSLYTLGLLVLKHKVGLLMIGNVILVMNAIVPSWFEIAKSLFN